MDPNPTSNPNPPVNDGAPAAILGMVGNCKSTKGISVAVVDANAVIEGGQSLTNFADKFVTVPEVLSEIRDPALAFIPFTIDTMEPSPESLAKVIKFARATGDLQTLSDVDLKLIALTYTLEAQIHGEDDIDQDIEVEAEGIDWRPAVSRSTRVRFLRRKEKWEHYNALAEQEIQQDQEADKARHVIEDTADLHQQSKQMSKDASDAEESHAKDGEKNGEDLPSILKDMRLEEDSLRDLHEGTEETNAEATLIKGDDDIDHDSEVEAEGIDVANQELEIASEAGDTLEASSIADDISSEQSWSVRALSESSVACITGDYAMQNVILQMGLRLLAPGGMQIRQLHRWILKCHACYTVTPEIGRIFCPKCGNGGTLLKVAATIGENGTILTARRPRITLRGTKVSTLYKQNPTLKWSCKSTKGISVAVVDANAVIEGGQSLTNFADKFVTVPEVLSEICDPASRRRLAFIPFTIDTMEPSPESLAKVIKFARATGDLQTLSDVDLKLIALTYTLEAQIHGTKNLRDVPPLKILEEDSLRDFHEGTEETNAEATVINGEDDIDHDIEVEAEEIDVANQELEIASDTLEASSIADDGSSEQSWSVRALSESSVACITGDYAMQNVILQMGLRLLAPGGMQIRQLHRWILKCHACYTVTPEIGRIFCPKCGNGGTLRKVAATIGENGTILTARRPRITLRGTQYSIPMPQGGREAITA